MNEARELPANWSDGKQPWAMPAPPNQAYGTQRRVGFAQGEARMAQLLEAGPTSLLWRVSASAQNGTFVLSWGTYGQNILSGLRSPFVASLPGAFSLQVEPIDPSLPMEAVGALSVCAGGESCVRSLYAVLGVLPKTASRVQALAAADVSVNATTVSLVPGQSLDIVAPSALVSGGPLLVSHAI
jgi:hypothetical protein